MSFVLKGILKSDIFGHIERGSFTQGDTTLDCIKRVYTKNLLVRPLAKFLAKNEKRALEKLQALKNPSIPELLETHKDYHIRSYIHGDVLHRSLDRLSPLFFSEGKKILISMRRLGVTNNDLEKPANWIVTEGGLPAITDFQLSICFKKKSKLSLIFGYEDLRHLLKQKKRFSSLRTSEERVVNRKSWMGKIWLMTGKKIYFFITRTLLKYKERVGYEERNI